MVDRACEKNWYKEALGDALDMMDNFEDEIIEQLNTTGEASDDVNNDYSGGDEYHNSSHVDRSYGLLESAHILSQLSDYEADDSGLWEGVDDPERALEVKVAYTYGNAVMGEFQDLIKELNEEFQDFTPVRRGPKEWRPGGQKPGPATIKEWLRNWLKERRDKLK
jgi:hypothetical protein